ncbi:MAG: ChbG/HpnK family deacetylase [Rhizomicrobium sp.]
MAAGARDLRVVVNADDLGLSPAVNDAIFAAIDAGRVTSATMLVNGDAFEDAVRRSRKYPHCSFGVHLNLTQFAPLSAAAASSPLVGDGGVLSSKWREGRLTGALRRAARAEFAAQIERATAALGSISHVDSHHHVHTLPALFPALAAVVWRYGVRRVRLSRNHYEPAKAPGPALLLKKYAWNRALRWGLRVRTTDCFTDLATFAAAPIAGGVVELMVHPGHPSYAAENDILAGDWPAHCPAQISMIGYDQV